MGLRLCINSPQLGCLILRRRFVRTQLRWRVVAHPCAPPKKNNIILHKISQEKTFKTKVALPMRSIKREILRAHQIAYKALYDRKVTYKRSNLIYVNIFFHMKEQLIDDGILGYYIRKQDDER